MTSPVLEEAIPEVEERSARWPFWLLFVFVSALLILYGVTRAFVWDEGYHLMAAQQISLGKLPYLDFCFPQTPLNAFLNAAVIHFFGQHWKPIHVVAALLTIGSALLVALFLLARFPVPRWRLACAMCALVFVGMDQVIVQFAPIGQAYAICLFCTTAAYFVAVKTPARVTLLLPLIAGVFAGIAANSSLLTAPVLPVMALWIWKYDRVGFRWRKALAFCAGVGVAFLPLLWLYVKSPEQTWFNVVRYHALYRRVDWPAAMANHHDLLVFTSLPDSTQALTLFLLGAAGVVFLLKQSDWPLAQKAEFYLAAWIATGEGLYLCTPHPTFSRYFMLLVPFITIASMPGLYWVASKFGYAERPARPAWIAGGLMALMFSPFTVQTWDQTTWQEYEKIAKKVAEVTPKGGRIFADELVYFILQQSPPSGMECSYTHALKLPPKEEELQHLVSEDDLRQQLSEHQFDTVQSCTEAEMEKLGMPGPYRYRNDIDECSVYWGSAPQ